MIAAGFQAARSFAGKLEHQEQFSHQEQRVQTADQAVANSSLTAGDLIFSMLLICGLYTLFLVAELFLMFKFARKGPSSLKTGRYHLSDSGRFSGC